MHTLSPCCLHNTRMIRHSMAASWMFFWSSLIALAPSVEAWAIHRKGGARLIPQQSSSVCVLCGSLLLTATTSLPAPATAVSWLDGISSVKAPTTATKVFSSSSSSSSPPSSSSSYVGKNLFRAETETPFTRAIREIYQDGDRQDKMLELCVERGQEWEQCFFSNLEWQDRNSFDGQLMNPMGALEPKTTASSSSSSSSPLGKIPTW